MDEGIAKKKSKKSRVGARRRPSKNVAVTIVSTDDAATKNTRRQPARKSFKKKNSNAATTHFGKGSRFGTGWVTCMCDADILYLCCVVLLCCCVVLLCCVCTFSRGDRAYFRVVKKERPLSILNLLTHH